ncbi:glycosyltransferase family 2 protein [Serratia sp. S1B]|nr:glycosyltransferase family 2 protein [Serratia sp. S1B]
MTNKDTIDVSLLITFHNEGILAHSTLNSIERCRKFAEAAGISTEYVWVLDAVSDETREVIMSHPVAAGNVLIVEVSHRDAGASRNSGIQAARGIAVAILDGDDYFSTNWIERAWHSLKEYGDRAVLHPEMVVNFGAQQAYCWQVDQIGPYYDPDGLLVNNFWTCWTFAKRSVYLECPYSVTYPLQTGFGYEDWHWNCELIAAGYFHRLVWGTVGFYRRKKTSSLVNATTSVGAIIPPTNLFN